MPKKNPDIYKAVPVGQKFLEARGKERKTEEINKTTLKSIDTQIDHIYIYIYIYIYVCVCVCVCVCTQIGTYMHIRKHTCTRTQK